MENGDFTRVSRRSFLKGAALAGGVAAIGGLAGCSPSADTSSAAPAQGMVPDNWDMEADVVICGGGGTGLAAAIEAADAGAHVLVLEKAAAPGGSTALSGGVMQAAGTSYQKEYTQFWEGDEYLNDTPEKHAELYIKCGEGVIDEDLVRAMTAGMPDDIEWIMSQGLEIDYVYSQNHVPYLDDTDLQAPRIHVYKGGGADSTGAAQGGTLLTGALQNTIDSKGDAVQIETNTEVTRLIFVEGTGVVGVEATQGSSTIAVKAKKGVVIATAGFDRNVELAKEHNAQQYWDQTSQLTLCAPTDTGDGIRMGMEIGAALANPAGCIDYDATTYQGTGMNMTPLACVYVNGLGHRFTTEDATYAYTYRAVFQQVKQWDSPTYMILDANGVSEGPLWMDGGLDEYLADGRVLQADTLEQLAETIDVPAANLVSTLDRWNANAASGSDPDFGRITRLEPISTPPFYAMPQVSMNLGSLGGLKINTEAQVIDTKGDPIPHLFAGGLATGGWCGPYYPGSGTAVGAAIRWGRQAGMSAAGASTWE